MIKKRGKVISFPQYLEKQYQVDIFRFVKKTIKFTKEKLYPALSYYYETQNIKADSYVDDFEFLIETLKKQVDNDLVSIVVNIRNISKLVSSFTLKQVAKSLSQSLNVKVVSNKLGIDIFADEKTYHYQEMLSSWVYANTRLIKSIPEKMLDDVAILVQQGFREGRALKYLAEDIEKKFNVALNRAKLIARDQIAKLHSDFTIEEFRNNNIKEYEWLTSNDERVRASHKVLNGKICNIENASIYKDRIDSENWKSKNSINGVNLQVGQDFQCRCSFVPIL